MCIMNYVRRPSLATYTFSLAQTSYKLKTKLTLVGNMSHTRETDSEINSGREKFVNENFAELFENMAKMMTEIERIKKMITDQHKKLDRKLTDYQGEMRKEMNEVKTRLDKIEKITDSVEKKTKMSYKRLTIFFHLQGKIRFFCIYMFCILLYPPLSFHFPIPPPAHPLHPPPQDRMQHSKVYTM